MCIAINVMQQRRLHARRPPDACDDGDDDDGDYVICRFVHRHSHLSAVCVCMFACTIERGIASSFTSTTRDDNAPN